MAFLYDTTITCLTTPTIVGLPLLIFFLQDEINEDLAGALMVFIRSILDWSVATLIKNCAEVKLVFRRVQMIL